MSKVYKVEVNLPKVGNEWSKWHTVATYDKQRLAMNRFLDVRDKVGHKTAVRLVTTELVERDKEIILHDPKDIQRYMAVLNGHALTSREDES